MIGTSSETIANPDSMEYSYEVVQPCDGGVGGSITISDVLGGVAPYQYSINCGLISRQILHS